MERRTASLEKSPKARSVQQFKRQKTKSIAVRTSLVERLVEQLEDKLSYSVLRRALHLRGKEIQKSI